MPIKKAVPFLLFVFLMASIHNSTAAGSSNFSKKCPTFYKNLTALKPIFTKSAGPIGMIIGGANDVLITCLHCSSGIVPEALGNWLPLANEIANVASTSTGQKWIYSGPSKSLSDGIAIGAIAGHSLTATLTHGPMAGGITLAANLGLTYWFPNKYFHPIMHDSHKLIPKGLKKIKSLAQSSAAHAVIGVSMIFLIEKLLQHAEQLSEGSPVKLVKSETTTPPTASNIPPEKAIAAFLLTADLDKEDDAVFLPYILNFSDHNEDFSEFYVEPHFSQLSSTRIESKINSAFFSNVFSDPDKQGAIKRVEMLTYKK